MADVLEEVTGDTLSRQHVERRLDDWEKRIRNLYQAITFWLEPDLKWKTKVIENAARIYEEPMRATQVVARMLPSITLFTDGEPRARIEPRGLWIIGANGRLDLAFGIKRYIIVDIAENFAAPQWMVMPALDRMNRSPFVHEYLSAIFSVL